MKVLLLGAGASRAYSDSPTKLPMPLARDFFDIFPKLELATHPWVLFGKTLNYARDELGLSIGEFLRAKIDIEEFFSGIEEKLIESAKQEEGLQTILISSVYNELLFIFAFAINQIQNGPASSPHRNIARSLAPDDCVVTFNWDTLMDRALAEETEWRTDFGYGVSPKMIYRDGWEEPSTSTGQEAPLLLKLHGSTNWITSYLIFDREKWAWRLTQTSSPETLYVYEYTKKPYATYEGRYMEGHAPFSYGYYPPNLPDSGISAKPGHVFLRARFKFPWVPEGKADKRGLNSMPLIIAPVKEKSYDFFGALLKRTWQLAEDALTQAEHVVIIGYSFPRTDHQSNKLFARSLSRRSAMPNISILNPEAEKLKQKFMGEFGVPAENIRVIPEYFSGKTDLKTLLR